MDNQLRQNRWIILTGEYPPQCGGVGDYTQLVARGLAGAGDQVEIWAPAFAEGEAEPGLVVHRLADHFGSRGLSELTRAMDTLPRDSEILVQYVPHAFGKRAMNLRFCLWLFRYRRRFPITVMFHEVACPWVTKGKLVRHNILALVNRLMVLVLVRSARRLCISIPSWEGMLRPYASERRVEWAPIPSTMPQSVDPELVTNLRQQLLSGEERLIGHFGTYKGHVAAALRRVIPEILTIEPRAVILLVGHRAKEFDAELQKAYPGMGGRVIASGHLESRAVSTYLSACDLLIQPYPDGISSRRTSSMAGLACGAPILTTTGPLTEPIWQASGAVSTVGTLPEMAPRAVALLGDKEELARLRAAAVALYNESFHVDRTVSLLRGTTSKPSAELSENHPSSRPFRASTRPAELAPKDCQL